MVLSVVGIACDEGTDSGCVQKCHHAILDGGKVQSRMWGCSFVQLRDTIATGT